MLSDVRKCFVRINDWKKCLADKTDHYVHTGVFQNAFIIGKPSAKLTYFHLKLGFETKLTAFINNLANNNKGAKAVNCQQENEEFYFVFLFNVIKRANSLRNYP